MTLPLPAGLFAPRVLPVVVLERAADALPLVDALAEGGLTAVEITLRTPAALDGIRAIRSGRPEVTVGAGTVLDPSVVPELSDLGVGFAVAPGLSPTVVEATQAAGMPLFAGVTSPTEIEQARSFGLEVLKFFPAEPLGGARMLKALIGPYGHTGLRFIPTGGIDLERAATYAPLDAVAAIGGSWFVGRGPIREQRWAEITAATRQAIATMNAEPRA